MAHFVRHGATDALGRRLSGRRSPAALNARGVAQARALADHFSERPIRAVYSSPTARALETAEPIAGGLGARVEIDDALDEIEFGDWTGATFGALAGEPAWAFWNVARSQHRPPGGESMIEVQARIALWLERAAAIHPEAEIIAVSHADVIKAALAYALGLPLDQHARLDVDPASISTVVAEPWGLRVRRVNEVIPWTE